MSWVPRDYDCFLLLIATARSWAKARYDTCQDPKWRPKSVVETSEKDGDKDEDEDEKHCRMNIQGIFNLPAKE